MAISSTLTAGVVTIEINRTAHRNTLNSADAAALTQALVTAQQEPAARVVLLKGQPGIFCAGADLEETKAHNPELDDNLEQLFATLAHFPLPIVAEVDGPAVAEGLTLLLYCDLVYCSERSLFSMPSIALAQLPRFGAASALMLMAGARASVEKLLLSEPIDAQEALHMNLVTGVYRDEDIEKVAAAKTARLAVLPPEAVARTKALLRSLKNDVLQAHRELEAQLYQEQRQSPEAREALAALMENRRPVYA